MKDLGQYAVMNIDAGEKIAGMWITPLIPGTGFYKLLAKKKKDGTFEWVQLIQRENGEKKIIFRGETKTKKELEKVQALSSKTLQKTFGEGIKFTDAKYDAYTLDGTKADSEIN